MAGWIKMRAGLLTSPKVVAITRRLSENISFRWWLTPEDNSFADHVTDDALRCVTCALLMSVWSCARDFGKERGDDLVLEHLTLADLDKIGGAPGLGDAMASVGWAAEDKENICVILPNFNEHNTPATAAERQAAYRTRKKERDGNVTQPCNASATRSNANVAPREEKRRIEEIPPNPPKGGGDDTNGQEAKSHFDHTAQGLSTAWVFYLRRTKNRSKADDPADVSPIMQALIDHGLDPPVILAEIERKDRDKSEYPWEFKKRMLRDSPKQESPEQLNEYHRKCMAEAAKYAPRNRNGKPS